MMHEILVKTTSGYICGREGFAFLGVPYGTAKRFQPAEFARWDGVKDCTCYGSQCCQPNYKGPKPADLSLEVKGSEDCLNLNIWTPDLDPNARLPVAIYVHGGGYQVGSNSHPQQAGDRFAHGDRMVFVSVNYRLGVLGGLYLKDLLGEAYAQSANNAELDLLLAIRWVRDNAAVFGGNPNNITLLGISAGAKNIGAVMTLKESEGLFRQVLLESGGMQALRTPQTASALTRRYLRCLPGIRPEELLTVPVDTLIRAQAELCDCAGSTCFFGPVFDEEYFHSDWRERWEAGEGWKGTALIGTGRNEMFRAVHNPNFVRDRKEEIENAFGDNAPTAFRTAGRLMAEGCTEEDAWLRVYSDFMYRAHGDRLAQRLVSKGCRVWQYSFEFLPAIHGMGFAFTMRQERNPMSVVSQEEMEKASRLADCMNRSARQFILTGNPQCPDFPAWQPSEQGSTVKLFYDETLEVKSANGDFLPETPEYNYGS